MSTPVEAQSLSSLTYLFANPPQYPRNPTHQVHQPLILYIVRVPGSQDVFLTPLKPPTKASISLEAIQSSLYYLHVPVPEDEEVRQSIPQENLEHTEEPKLISRKPLPNVPYANYPPSERPEPPPKFYPHYQPGLNGPLDTQAERYAARGSHLRLSTSPDKHVRPRQTLAPDRLSQQYSSTSSQSDVENSSGLPERPLPPYATTQERSSFDSSRSSPYSTHNDDAFFSAYSSSPGHPTLRELQSTIPTSKPITLIRRDPSSSSQWNIGTITHLRPTFAGSGIQPVLIEITTPGYGRFNGQKEIMRPGSACSDAASIKIAVDSAVSSPGYQPEFHPSQHFARTVDFRVLDQSMVGQPGLVRRRTDSIDVLRPNSPLKNDHVKEKDKPKNVLSFPSVWQGAVCTFSNGLDGRTLRLKHTVPSHSSNDAEGIHPTRNVAELRFNLPWSLGSSRDSRKPAQKSAEPDKLPISQLLEAKKKDWRRSLRDFKHKSFEGRKSRDFPSPTRPEAGLENSGRKYDLNYRHGERYDYDDARLGDATNLNLHPPAQPAHNTEEERDRISLRLGREKAGGGYKGKSAKLGKLIIEDEGLKMADLVVAACMGVWWQHYQDIPNDEHGSEE